ncbi:MAG: hypothetical protein AB2A00_10590 [Myxococcota bacterium]
MFARPLHLAALVLATATIITVHANGSQRKAGTGLAWLLADMLTTLSTDQANSPRVKHRLEDEARELVVLSRHDHGERMAGDPTARTMMDLLESESREVEFAVREGRMPYARRLLVNVSRSCVACHTSAQDEPLYVTPQLLRRAEGLRPLERAPLLQALRRYDEAASVYASVVRDEGAPPRERSRAAEEGLALAVRVQRSAPAARAVIQAVMESHGTAASLRESAASWSRAVEAWEAEASDGARPTEAQLADNAQRLVAEGMAVTNEGNPGAGAVQLHRAANMAHEQLARFPQGARAAEASYVLGVAWRELPTLSEWFVHPAFLDRCVRMAPHTPVAKDCAREYEVSMTEEFRPAAGEALPREVAHRLSVIQALSR